MLLSSAVGYFRVEIRSKQQQIKQTGDTERLERGVSEGKRSERKGTGCLAFLSAGRKLLSSPSGSTLLLEHGESKNEREDRKTAGYAEDDRWKGVHCPRLLLLLESCVVADVFCFRMQYRSDSEGKQTLGGNFINYHGCTQKLSFCLD